MCRVCVYMFITAGPVIDSELCARGTGDALLFCYRLYDRHWQHNLGLGRGAHARGKRWARGRGDALLLEGFEAAPIGHGGSLFAARDPAGPG